MSSDLSIPIAKTYVRLSIFKEEFTKYAFYNDDVEKEYLKSSDYLDITSKLSNSNFREELRKKVLTK